MHPHTNSFPHNHPACPNGVQSFDLKVNVDFNTGHVRLNMPHGPPDPFTRKQLIPITHTISPQQPNPIPQYIPLAPQPPYHHQPSPASNHKVSLSTLAPQASGSLNSTFHMEQSLEAVECVICQKIIRREEFHLHLEEHRNRRKTEPKVEKPQLSFQHSSEVSIRDKNSFAEATELIKEMPYQQQRRSQSNLLYFPSQSSRQSVEPPIFYGSPQSEFFLSQSSNFSKPSHEVSQFSPQNSLTPGFQQTNQMRTFQNQSLPMQIISQSQSFPIQRPPNPFDFHRIESVIIRPQINKSEDQLDYCGQSVISRNSLPSRQSSVYEIQRELEKKPEDECSSDEEDFHYRTYPAKAHHSMGWTQPQPVKKDEMKMSQYTQKSSRTKLPLNYLAREQFISNSTLNSWTSKSKFPQ